MLEITLTTGGYVPNQEISLRLFEQVGNAIIRVICKEPCYMDVNALEDSICDYMNTFMPAGIEVKTNHVTQYQSIGIDSNGRYIGGLDFQVYI